MGVSYTHGDRSTGGSRARLPLDPKMGVCAECGAERQVLTTPIGDIYAPLEGTWWNLDLFGLTCSVMCRLVGGYPAGPFDEL